VHTVVGGRRELYLFLNLLMSHEISEPGPEDCGNYGCFDIEAHITSLLGVFAALIFTAFLVERFLHSAEVQAERSKSPLLGAQMVVDSHLHAFVILYVCVSVY
jgi:hypothetical protein